MPKPEAVKWGGKVRTVRPIINCLRAQHPRWIVTALPLLVAAVSVGRALLPAPPIGARFRLSIPPLSPISPASIWTGFSPDDVPSSGSVPMVAPEPEKQSVRSEKKSAHAFSSSSNGPILIHSVVTFRAVTADHLHQALGEFLRESPPPSRTDNDKCGGSY